MSKKRRAIHFLRLICSLGLLASPQAPGQGPQAEVIVNQTGSLPVTHFSGTVSFKFAILTEAPGIEAAATASLQGSSVAAITITNAGAGYLAKPAVTIVGGGGHGAKAVAAIANGAVTSITLENGGSGYAEAPVVKITPPQGQDIQTLWSNDGTSVNGSEPEASVGLETANGQYSALLGYTGLPNMAALPADVLSYLNPLVRIWYEIPPRTKFFQASPDLPLRSVPYAEQAGYSAMAGTVPNGSISAAQIAAGTITAAQIAPGTITGAQIGAGTITASNLAPGATSSANLHASLTPGDPSLTSQGFIQIQSIPSQNWMISSASGAPGGRSGHTVIWTGNDMIVWGGTVNGSLNGAGGDYQPATATWSTLPTVNSPAARTGHTAVWTGSQMVVWGGATVAKLGGDSTGGVYNEANQAWQAMATASAPDGRKQHTAVWTGSQMIVWGGLNPLGTLGDGGLYTPPSNSVDLGSWTALPASSVVGVRANHTAVWTGSKMIVWGGSDAQGNSLGTGAAYDPVSGAWSPISSINAPSPRSNHTAVWSGTVMIVFGGLNGQLSTPYLNDGGVYDPAADSWTALPASGAPDPRANHAAVWTGSEMLVFSGMGMSGDVLTAGAFNPATNAWRTLPPAPGGATSLAGVWSGESLLAFGLGGLDTLNPAPAVYLYGRF